MQRHSQAMEVSRRAHAAAQKCYSRCKKSMRRRQSFFTAGAGVRECLPHRLITASAPRLEELHWFSFGRPLLGEADKWRVLIRVYKDTRAQKAGTLKATSMEWWRNKVGSLARGPESVTRGVTTCEVPPEREPRQCAPLLNPAVSQENNMLAKTSTSICTQSNFSFTC